MQINNEYLCFKNGFSYTNMYVMFHTNNNYPVVAYYSLNNLCYLIVMLQKNVSIN